MAADERALGELHNQVAIALGEALKGIKLPEQEDADGVIQPAVFLPPSAAIIQAAAKFLKDNQITCAPAADNSLGELEKIMADRNKRKADRADLAAAREATDFILN